MAGPEIKRTTVAGVMTIVNHKSHLGAGGFRLKGPFSAVNLPLTPPNSTKVQRLTGTEDQISTYGTALQKPQRTFQHPTPCNFEVRKSHRAPSTPASEIRSFQPSEP